MDVKLGEYCRGIVTLIVNIGSACGLTAANYAQLTQINKDFDGSKIEVLSILFLVPSFTDLNFHVGFRCTFEHFLF